MKRSFVALLAGLSFLATALTATSASADPAFGGEAVPGGMQFTLTQDEVQAPSAVTSEGPGGARDRLVVTLTCESEDAFGCGGSFQAECAGMPADDDGNRWRPVVLVYEQGSRIDGLAPFEYSCENFAAAAGGPSAAEIVDYLYQALPVSAATTNPRVSPTTGMVETLVGLPLILHYDDSREFAADVELAGFPVHVQAYARAFAWTAGPNVVSSEEVGRPYSRQAPCDQHACRGYLVAPAFEAMGFYPLQLSVEWAATFQVAGGPSTQISQPIAIDSPQLTIRVAEARAVLVSGEEYE